MAVTPNESASQRMAARAEALGERVGRSMARARRRFESSRQAEQGGAPERPAGNGQLVHRADDLVSRFERGVASYATVVRDRLRRGVARIREEAEDIAAEAAHLRETQATGEPQRDEQNRREAEPAA